MNNLSSILRLDPGRSRTLNSEQGENMPMLINSPHPAFTVYPVESTPSRSIIAYALLVSLRYDNVYSIFPLQGLYFLIYTVL